MGTVSVSGGTINLQQGEGPEGGGGGIASSDFAIGACVPWLAIPASGGTVFEQTSATY
jgi:hypothetical protein